MSQHVHIICAEVPWPADHSKAIDSFCQIKELFEHGLKIHLHYFCSDLHCHPTELNRYCESVHKYQKKENKALLFSSDDQEPDFQESINKDNYPVIVEGVYCSGVLSTISQPNRKILVRMYDDECRNCDQAAKYASPFLQKYKLNKLSKNFRQIENSLPEQPIYVFSIPENAESFHAQYPDKGVVYLPLLYPFNEIISETGSGNFCLYHGDLSDACNEKAAHWLLTKVFNDMNVPIVVAGRHASRRIQKLAHLYSHSCFIADPSTTEIEDLIRKAHIHVLPSFSYKKPELKLIHALHAGRHCIVNEEAIAGTGLEETCYTAATPAAFKSVILQLLHRPFEEPEIKLRENIFQSLRKKGPVQKLIDLLTN